MEVSKFDDYIKVAEICSGRDTEYVIDKAREYHKDNYFIKIEHGLIKYLRDEFGTWAHEYSKEVLKLGRKLSNLEVETLRLRDKVKRENAKEIQINIEGL